MLQSIYKKNRYKFLISLIPVIIVGIMAPMRSYIMQLLIDSSNYKELLEKGQNVTFGEVLENIITRDKNDSEREFAPLKKADDAYEFDTTTMSIDEVVKELLSKIK